jgi:NADPH2:quinone reductase
VKAVVVHEYGDAGKLSLADMPLPEPGPGEALVRQTVAGLNFIDIYVRSGLYAKSHTYAQTLPVTLGMEGAGVVAAVGEDVNDIRPGDRVAYCLELGSYAEYALVPAWKLVKVPGDIGLDTAAALMLQGSTAHYLTHSLYPLQPGETCLLHAGAGGVGQLAIQLAKARGATVIATVGTGEKADIARARGADHVVIYTQEDFAARVADITGGQGVHVVYDSVGRATFEHSLKCLRRRGTMVSFGAASGAIEAVSPLGLAEAGSVFFTRPHLADYIPDAAARRERAGDLFRLCREGKLTVTLDRRWPLAEAAAAQRALEGRESRGKLLLEIGK